MPVVHVLCTAIHLTLYQLRTSPRTPFPKTPSYFFFFFNDPPPPEIYPLPLHDALPISGVGIAPVGHVTIIDRDHFTPFPLAEVVPEQVARDGEQPAAKGSPRPPASQSAERPEEGLLQIGRAHV